MQDYLKKTRTPSLEGLEAGIKLDPNTGLLNGFTGKILFREPNQNQVEKGYISIEKLLKLTNDSLHEHDFQIWIILDRLDVAFAEDTKLEENALRALFKVYLDLFHYEFFSTKIFLRTDIWNRITKEGFREASHITKHTTIRWDRRFLLNLIIRRILKNDTITNYCRVKKETILSDFKKQESLFYRLFPEKIDLGANKPNTLDWILSRVCDGTKEVVPRELIHLLSCAKEIQIRKYEIGERDPGGEILFSRNTLKEALYEVSKVRLEQTIFAEYPNLKHYILRLEREKTNQNIDTLSDIWNIDKKEATLICTELVSVGFFEQRGDKSSPTFWVPFLYREALNLVQGSAF